jgi:hypothetical protein
VGARRRHPVEQSAVGGEESRHRGSVASCTRGGEETQQ